MVDASPIGGLVLTPGASARRGHPALVAIDLAATARGVAVERVEFPGQATGRRRPDPPAVCMEVVASASSALADRLGLPLGRVAVGGRSMGGRMCSRAVAAGLEAAALVLVSYPLHPPGRSDRLRTEHFPDLRVPCLFLSGRRDPFATVAELEQETKAIAGPVTLEFVPGDHGLRGRDTEVAELVAGWLVTVLAGRR